MPVVIFFAGLDLKQKSSFMDGHYLAKWSGNDKYKSLKTSDGLCYPFKEVSG